MLNTPRWSTLTLSKGSIFANTWQAIKDPFPANSETYIYFYDSGGNEIGRAEGAVSERKLTYLVEPPHLDDIPRGASYELKVITDDGPYLYEYGNVARREATFYNPGAQLVEANESRLFIDPLDRNSIGRKWKPIWGGVAMHGVPGGWGMGSNVGLLFAESAVRYYRPLGGDSFRVKFGVYAVPNLSFGAGGSGKMQFLSGMDINSHIGFGVEIEHGLVNRNIRTGIITAPTDLNIINSVVQPVGTADYITVDYSDLTKLYRVYFNENPNPILQWLDDDQYLPKGRGYRYFGFAWDSSLLATGPLLRGVEIQDQV